MVEGILKLADNNGNDEKGGIRAISALIHHGLNDCQVVTKKASWAPGPCANFQEITMESMPVLPLEESGQNTLTSLT